MKATDVIDMSGPLDLLSKKALDLIAENRPDLWHKCYPRIYRETANGQYASVKVAAGHMISAALKFEEGFSGDNEKVECAWASRLVQYRVPTYWITPDMAEAIKKTTPPQQIDIAEMKLPFEAALFMIPRGTLTHDDPNEGDAAFVSYYRLHTKDVFPSLAAGLKEFTTENGVMAFLAHTGNHLLHWTLPDNQKLNLGALDDLVQLYDGVPDHESQWPSLFDMSMNHFDNAFMGRVCHFVLGTVMLMLARPDLLTVGALQKRIHKANQAPKEFWSPNIIGEHYKIRKLYMSQGGTHASPRGHWVRGFYREQPHGPQHSLRKQIWVEPFWRGGEVS